jgi:ribonuclease T1
MTHHLIPREPSRPVPRQSRKAAGSTAAKVGVALISALLWWAPATQAFTRTPAPSATSATVAAMPGIVPLSQLPSQGQEVYRRVLSGGPFLYSKDGMVFGNRERQLPRKTRGYYHEYTVPTPGSRDRGARRIVCGGEIVQSPETCFYTQDHYQSFQKIDPKR